MSPTAPSTNVRGKPAQGDTDNRLLYKIAGALATGAGWNGSDFVSDTANHTGDWGIISIVEDAIFSSIGYRAGTHSTANVAGRTLVAGTRLYGFITDFKLASGSVEAYRNAIG